MASIDSLDVLKSSESFVRALKSAADPPYEKGPSKIQIARQGWEFQPLYVPRKADLLLEWIITRFHKEKSKESSENPLVDATHWSLLADILSHSGDYNVIPLVTRTSIPGLVSSFLTLYPTIPDTSRDILFPPVLRSLDVLWPLAVQRAGIDPLSECFWTSLSVFSHVNVISEGNKLIDVFDLVVIAFRSAFDSANSAGKKKVYLTLVQCHLHSLLRALHILPPAHSLHVQLYALGVEVLLNADSLRTSLESSPKATTSTDVFSALFGPSMKSDPSTHLTFIGLLPRLTTSFFATLRKHRSTICTSTPTSQQSRALLRHARERFGSACLGFLKDSKAALDAVASVWAARVGVLTVYEEGAFDLAENSNFVDDVREVAQEAIQILDGAWDISRSGLVIHALDALACLHRMEPDILMPFIPNILERLATCSSGANNSSKTLLSQLISYHSKTRTLHTFISLLLAAVASAVSVIPLSDMQEKYGAFVHSPLLSLSFADELATSLRAFMTPGQADAILTTAHAEIETCILTRNASGEPALKRRKLSVEEEANSHHADQYRGIGHNAVKFALVVRLSVTTLTAVLHGSTRGDAAKRRKASLYRMDALISGVLEASLKTEKAWGGEALKRKRAAQGEDFDAWCNECFSTALLRLWYDFFVRSGSPGSEIEENTLHAPGILDRLYDDLLIYMGDSNAQPELQLEIGRVLLGRGASMPQEETSSHGNNFPALDVILDYIEQNILVRGKASATTTLTGKKLATITRTETARLLWSITLERHLSTIDTYASPTQLERLASLMTGTASDLHVEMSGSSVLARTLTSASFWEFNNLRASLLVVLEKETKKLAVTNLQQLLSSLLGGDLKGVKALLKSHSLRDVERVVKICRLLHYFPLEYLPKSSRLELAKRALAADVLAQALNHKRSGTPLYVEWQAILRSFLVMVKTRTRIGFFDEIASFPEWMPYWAHTLLTADAQLLIDSTLSLLSSIYMSGMCAASEGKDNLLSSILTYFLHKNPFMGGNKQEEYQVRKTLLEFLSMLVGDFKVLSFGTRVMDLLRNLYSELDGCLRSSIGAIASEATVTEFLQSGHVIEAWQVLLSFKQWLSIPKLLLPLTPYNINSENAETEIVKFCETILKRTASAIRSVDGPDVPKGFRANVLSLVVQHGNMLPEMQYELIGIMAAAYVLFTESAPTNSPLCDGLVVRAIKRQSVLQFEVFLELVAEAMERHLNRRSETELMSLLHLSMLLLREAPEKTSRLCHEHVGRCFRVFVNNVIFTDCSTALCAQVISFIQFQCTERAALLKPLDIASIWSILSSLLAGSKEHDDHTPPSIFHMIVSSVDALIRLRRDLISSHLPQLSMILRQLIIVIRGVRTLLGTKQYHLVSNTLPRWINPQEPLGEDEARILARLLTALTTKSIVRFHSSNDHKKAESMASSFRRHAPYVLLAYIQLMEDPLSVLSITMRRELEPGLFALCNMMGEHGRDTLMIQSLDTGGKALLKSLWKEYSKRKYVGEG